MNKGYSLFELMIVVAFVPIIIWMIFKFPVIMLLATIGVMFGVYMATRQRATTYNIKKEK